ncbi:MAG: ester cyclase [Anaerolineae bacterium]
MSIAENKAIVDRYREEVFNDKDLAAVDKYVAPDYVRHDPGAPVEVRGLEGVKQLAGAFFAAFPDIHFTAEDVIAEGDTVVQRLTSHGTHQGPFMGIPPTGKHLTVTAVEIFRLVEGKIAEQWVEADYLGLMQQLGVIPPMG